MGYMNLTDKQRQKLENADLVALSHEARQQTASLLNDQGFAVLSVAVANLIAEAIENPEKLIQASGL